MYNGCVKKLLTAFITLIAILFLAAGCVEGQPPADDNGNGSNQGQEDPARFPFEIVSENGKKYVYSGSVYSEFVGDDPNRVLSNLYERGMLTGENEVYDYAGTGYLRVTVTDDVAGRKLDNTVLEEGDSCFFKQTPMKFRVVGESESEIVLVPAVIYEYRRFNETGTVQSPSDYASSAMKDYLEGEYLNAAFSAEELAYVASVKVLSADEARGYLDVYSEDPLQFYVAAASDYLVASEADVNCSTELGNTASWWLDAECKDGDFGVVDVYGTVTSVTAYSEQGVRPVITLKKVL